MRLINASDLCWDTLGYRSKTWISDTDRNQKSDYHIFVLSLSRLIRESF